MWGDGWESGIVAFDSNKLTYRIAHSCLFVWRSRKQSKGTCRQTALGSQNDGQEKGLER